jgi:hypothetical protein
VSYESYCECDYDGEAPEFYSEHMVERARKPHKCRECGGTIAIGERYKYAVGKWNGDVDYFCQCIDCLEMHDWAKISVPCFCSNVWGELHQRVNDMVDHAAPDVPGFVAEWEQRAEKIRLRGGRPGSRRL